MTGREPSRAEARLGDGAEGADRRRSELHSADIPEA